MTFKELQEMLTQGTPEQIMALLRQKTVEVPEWGSLLKQYDPMLHPVMNTASYKDRRNEDGTIEKVTRIPYGLQMLAVKRMTELVNGIPPKRIYNPTNEKQQDVAKWIEAILQRNRINSVNTERLSMLFASCEVSTLWYAVEQPNSIYGFPSRLKIKCRNFSPMDETQLYPLFDEYGDMIAMSVQYARKIGNYHINYFDSYMYDRHLKMSDEGGEWKVVEDEDIVLLKIPLVYMYRPTPIWEGESHTVYELEWTMSRNGNYLRKNSKPVFTICSDAAIPVGKEKNENSEFRSIFRLPKDGTAQYVTWDQAVENLKFYINELRNGFFTRLQLPDWSYEKMSQQALSGESRKQLFIDAQMKVKDESGRLLEFFDREINVIKAFLKMMTPEDYAADIDALQVETEITPFTINDDRDTISNLLLANGNKPLMSQRESIEYLGWSADVDRTIQEISEDSKTDEFALTE